MEQIDRSISLISLPLSELGSKITEGLSEPRFRVQQIVKWVYQKRINTFEEMINTPKTLRQKLGNHFSIEKLTLNRKLVSSREDAVKFAFALKDCEYAVESVLLYDDDRRTACLSSQLGCGLGCVFCETGRLGFIRNLTQGEILGQLIGINDYLSSQGDKLVTNIVFMGMGEALSNFDNFRSSLEIIMHEDAFNIGGRRITVSTAGVIPSIERLMKEDLNIGLAISLNAYNDQQRSRVMPINNRYPIRDLVDIAKRYFEKTGRRVTFEYIIIDGETNTPEAVDALRKLLGGFPCKINLIPINPSSGSKSKSPEEKAIDKFSVELHKVGLSATIRKSRGRDIQGACGQLTAHILNEQVNAAH